MIQNNRQLNFVFYYSKMNTQCYLSLTNGGPAVQLGLQS